MKFSESIKYIRKVTYLSQEAFAKEIGVSFSTVNRWENEKVKPSYAAMKKIILFCNQHSIEVEIENHD